MADFGKILDDSIPNKEWLTFFKLYFHFIFVRLTPSQRSLYIQDIRQRYEMLTKQLMTQIYCQNCKSVFRGYDDIGCKKCWTHYGKLISKGGSYVWNCCNTVHEQGLTPFRHNTRKLVLSTTTKLMNTPTKMAENRHFPLGCITSDHWDLKAVKDQDDNSPYRGFPRTATLILPFLVYFTMIYDKYIQTGSKDEVKKMLVSIKKMSYNNTARQKIQKSLVFSQILDGPYSTESQRNYDPFFNTSDPVDTFSMLEDSDNPRIVTETALMNPIMADSVTYLDFLYSRSGIVELQKLIQNKTIPTTGNVFDKFLFRHLIMLVRNAQTGEMEELFANFQNVFLIDLLTMDVEIRRTSDEKEV